MNPLMMVDDDAGYAIQRSVRLRASAGAFFSRTAATTASDQTFTFVTLFKRGQLSQANNSTLLGSTYASSGSNRFIIWLRGTDDLQVTDINSTQTLNLVTSQVFRDPSASYHLVVAIDTTQAIAANRVKIYVNGLQITSFATAIYPAQNYVTRLNNSNCLMTLGLETSSSSYFDGYLAETCLVGGQQLTPSLFGEFDPVITTWWKPKKYTGTYGTNGFCLEFKDNSALTTSSNVGLGKDTSGNGNYWTTNNISITAGVTYDSMTDVPTLTSATAANYCVLNAVNQPTSTTLNDGNLKVVATTAAYRLTQSTFTLTSGKYYFEMTKLTASQYVNGLALVLPTTSKDTSTINASGIYAITHGNLNQISSYTNGGGSVTIGTVDWANNDIIKCAYDAATGKIWFGRNDTWYPATNGGTTGDPALGTNQTITGISGLTPTVISYDTSSSCAINFGQRPFSFTPPSGFVALNTFNTPAGTVATSGSFVGNVNTNGPSVYLNGVPTALTINGNAVTWGTHANKTAYGFQVISSSTLYNSTGTNTYSVTTVGAVLKYANAQGNP